MVDKIKMKRKPEDSSFKDLRAWNFTDKKIVKDQTKIGKDREFIHKGSMYKD